MLRMNGIEAWISDEDKTPFTVYGVEKDATTGVMSCWIAYEPGMNFAIRWQDLDSSVDIGGFVNIDSYQYGGRLIKSKSYAPAVFSRVQTSSTYSRPLAFPSHSPGEWPGSSRWPESDLGDMGTPAHHVRTPLGGTITLDVHVVTSGETRIHEGLSDLAAQRLCCSSQAPLLASLLPSSSTEVVSLGKIATFVFRYRTINFLRAHGLAPVDRQMFSTSFRTPHVGDKRSISSLESDLDDEDSDPASPTSLVPLYVAIPKSRHRTLGLMLFHVDRGSTEFQTYTIIDLEDVATTPGDPGDAACCDTHIHQIIPSSDLTSPVSPSRTSKSTPAPSYQPTLATLFYVNV
ncbi:hypothetical protein D9611_002013 [Ephemerocybe angulata]|uniref:Uncharacterized protein n=1 Tax=Ephemerocybe angulata TaxID=980116 RepID=A0A8H5FMP4_9AGAR|nr:hypothetical protein D9611_002013 [Tulosesus angulatus]